ncbi:MAG: retropepsin-like aspartic protease [Aeromonas sp.]
MSNYNEYIELLRDASLLLNKGCINGRSLIQRVISKSPTEIKSLLIIKAETSGSWDSFRKTAEESAWVAFPEKIVNSVERRIKQEEEDQQPTETVRIQRQTDQRIKKSLFCQIHEYGNHKTNECHIVKLVESKGWVRQRKQSKTDNDFIKNELPYYTMHSMNKEDRANNFFSNASINNKTIRVLLDTGADISVIQRDLVPSHWKINKIRMRAASATGGELGIEGYIDELFWK